MSVNLEVTGTQELRATVGTGRRLDGDIAELAIGQTHHTAFVRGPSGNLYAVEIPAELAEELREHLPAEVDVRSLRPTTHIVLGRPPHDTLESSACMMYEAAAEHVRITGHKDITACDDAESRTLGLLCRMCNAQWRVSYPGPGQLNSWPEALRRSSTIEARKAYLAKIIRDAATKKAWWYWLSEKV